MTRDEYGPMMSAQLQDRDGWDAQPTVGMLFRRDGQFESISFPVPDKAWDYSGGDLVDVLGCIAPGNQTPPGFLGVWAIFEAWMTPPGASPEQLRELDDNPDATVSGMPGAVEARVAIVVDVDGAVVVVTQARGGDPKVEPDGRMYGAVVTAMQALVERLSEASLGEEWLVTQGWVTQIVHHGRQWDALEYVVSRCARDMADAIPGVRARMAMAMQSPERDALLVVWVGPDAETTARSMARVMDWHSRDESLFWDVDYRRLTPDDLQAVQGSAPPDSNQP